MTLRANTPLASSLPTTSGDLFADRRFAWAQAAALEGDHVAAADLFSQTIEYAPQWAPAWFALGDAQDRLGDTQAAIAAFEKAASFDPRGSLGANLRLARLGAIATPATAPSDFVRGLFDQYAAKFDHHLVEGLGYCGPDLLLDAVKRIAPERHFSTALDLGCGTGLAGVAFRACAPNIIGMDLSPAMIAQARKTNVYTRLDVADIEPFLLAEADASAQLVLAADVFVYIGDLALIFAQCARVLSLGGLFAFTAQQAQSGTFTLGQDLRYAHARSYIEQLASDAQFDVALMETASTRRDAGVDVPGLIVVLARR